MADDVKLQILLQAKNASEQAFRELKGQLAGVQQELAKTAKAAESGFNLDRFKTQSLGAAAAVFAAYKTIGQAVDMVEAGAKLEKQAAGFENLAGAAGTSSRRMLEELKRASRGLVAEADLVAASGKALLMNIPAREIAKLMEIAAATSRMTGQAVTEAFNDITMGVARQSKMILDNLGIIVDVEKANADYAKSLGKTASALSDAEKRQAFMNAVVKSGDDMVRRLGASSGALEGANKLVAAQTDLWNEVNRTVASFLDKELAGYARMLTWIADKLKGMRAAAGEASKSDLWKEIEMLRSLEAKGMANPGLAAAKEAEWNRRFLAPQMGLKPSEELKRTGSWSTPRWDASGWRMQEGQYGDLTEAEKKTIIDKREAWLKQQAEAAKLTMEQLAAEVKKYQEEFQAALMGQSRLEEYMAGGQHENAILRMEEQRLARIREEAKADADRVKQTMEEIKAQGEQSMGSLVQLSQRTAEAMQDNFSDLFFDAMKGELKSLEDYANAIMDSILRAASDMAGQLATQAIFGPGAVGGTGGGGGLFGWIAGLFGGGGGSAMSQSTALALVRHAGGAVDGSGPHRQIPAWMIAAAPRLHGGLAPDEYPAVLQRGERVLSRREAARPAANITVNVQAPGGRIERESQVQLQAGLLAVLSRAHARSA